METSWQLIMLNIFTNQLERIPIALVNFVKVEGDRGAVGVAENIEPFYLLRERLT
jgi:hypothetical protein